MAQYLESFWSSSFSILQSVCDSKQWESSILSNFFNTSTCWTFAVQLAELEQCQWRSWYCPRPRQYSPLDWWSPGRLRINLWDQECARRTSCTCYSAPSPPCWVSAIPRISAAASGRWHSWAARVCWWRIRGCRWRIWWHWKELKSFWKMNQQNDNLFYLPQRVLDVVRVPLEILLQASNVRLPLHNHRNYLPDMLLDPVEGQRRLIADNVQILADFLGGLSYFGL